MLRKDKVAVISGAASPRGIGMATARLFAEHGARVAILDPDEAASSGAARDLGEAHRGFACDVTDRESIPLSRLGAAHDVAGAFPFLAARLNSGRQETRGKIG